MEIVEVTYEGLTAKVELKPCYRCKRLPTAENAQQALQHFFKTQKRCAVCEGFPPLSSLYGLYHSVDISCNGEIASEGYILCAASSVPYDPIEYRDWNSVNTYGPGGNVSGCFHTACLKKVAPGIEISPR